MLYKKIENYRRTIKKIERVNFTSLYGDDFGVTHFKSGEIFRSYNL